MSAPIQNASVQRLLQSQQTPKKPCEKPSVGEFDAFLSDKLKLSGHARTRLQSRDIQLDERAWERVLNGVDKAAEKGARDALVMVDDVALVVSVKNRTVITAVDRERLKENVFTNIDSAVIA
ncbi:MAG: hypothetical protein KIT11_11710 [Fimbriimonadaceae bacterium]|nr:hypothetical protein [Fimbriimonadaceae bacterium]QYK55300.1 MAG: hypothetical protein KF733_09825 [Fimbriimonadaceae bacterium]